MNVAAALELLWKEVARSSQSRVAERIGVSPATVTRWKGGANPEGESREKLIAWAEASSVASAPLTDDVLKRAAELTAYNLTRLQEIRGYAKFVYDQLLMLAGKQGEIVAALEPYAGLEADAETERMREKLLKTTQQATQKADREGSETEPSRRERRGRG